MAQFRKDTHQYLNDGRTIFEVVMLADQYGNHVGPANPTGMAVDAFGRARMSTPLTLFDSSHRYKDNGLWSTSNTATATYGFYANAGLVTMTLDTTSGAEIVRETTKIFSYQPGKSLQILNTFVLEPPKANLRQRVGYFGANNGIYLEANNANSVAFVLRSYSNNAIVETRAEQANWNIDTLLGAVDSSPSQKTLDLTKAQIMFTDIEWLGVGTVRCGFAIDGQFIHCHSFHHANHINSTYMTTASLPLRYEIKNTGATANNSTMKQICSTVITEGGYELRGLQQSVGTPVGTGYSCANAGTFYPVVSLRLKSSALDAIVIPTAASLLGKGNGIDFNWRLIAGGTVSNTVAWTDAGTNSAVEYTLTANSITGGRVLASGYFNSSTQSSPTINVLKEALFHFQLERNGLTSTPEPLTIAVAAGTASSNCYASLDWEEITR